MVQVKPGDGMGGMARRDDMASFATTHSIPCITIRQMQVRSSPRSRCIAFTEASKKTKEKLGESPARF